LEKAAKIRDEQVRMSLELQQAFDLRREEAIIDLQSSLIPSCKYFTNLAL
jgi:hypothetical protein